MCGSSIPLCNLCMGVEIYSSYPHTHLHFVHNRKPLTRGSCSGSPPPGSTQVTRLLTMSSSTTKCLTATSCTATTAPRAQRMMRQTTISNSEDLEATRVQVMPSCFKCSSYPQLTDLQCQMLTREGLSGQHK